MSHWRSLLPVVSQGSQSKSTLLIGPEGSACSGPAHPASSLAALSSQKKLCSLLPQGLCSSLCLKCSSSGSCSASRAQFNWHLSDPLISERGLFSHCSPCGSLFSSSIALALFCILFVYWCFLHYTMSPVKMVPCLSIITEVLNHYRKKKRGKNSANKWKLQRGTFYSV